MLAYLMTLSQYQIEVSPLIQELLKFRKKYKQFYMPGDFNGIILATYNQLVEQKAEVGAWSNLDLDYFKEKAKDDWQNSNKCMPVENVPAVVEEEFQQLMQQLSEFLPIVKLTIKWSFSNSLKHDEVRSNKRIIKDALSDGTYASLIEAGKISMERVVEILTSVGIRSNKTLEARNAAYKQKLAFKANPAMVCFLTAIEESFSKEIEDYRVFYTDAFTKQVNNFLVKVNEAKKQSVREEAAKLLSNTIAIAWYRLFKYSGSTVIKTENYKQNMVTVVEEYLVELKEDLLATLAGKVSMVLDELVSVEKQSLYINARGLEGTFSFTLKSGSFTIRTNAVYVEGEIQRIHYRYIAHYHNVVKDGKDYGTCNFEQMVKLFGKEIVKK